MLQYMIRCAPVWLLLTLVACHKSADSKGDFKRQPMPVAQLEGYIVKPSALQNNLNASGTLLPFEQTVLYPEMAGRIVSLNLPEGKRVAKGALLVKIFDEDLQTRLRQLQAQLEMANLTAERLKGLANAQGVSQQEYDQAVLQAKNLAAEIELTQVRIRQTEIRAPYDGVIGLRQISPGAYITPATPVATIRDDRQLRLDFSVPEKYGVLVKNGQRVQFRVDGSQRSFSAVVQASEQSVDAATRDLRLRALVSERHPDLVAGRFAEIDLALTTQPNAMLVPTEAVIPQARDKKVVVARNGKASFVTVNTGARQADLIEVTNGIQPGDTIVTTGILFLRPDAALQFSKVE
jgi:membrane fusion protein, multidrug efflux system